MWIETSVPLLALDQSLHPLNLRLSSVEWTMKPHLEDVMRRKGNHAGPNTWSLMSSNISAVTIIILLGQGHGGNRNLGRVTSHPSLPGTKRFLGCETFTFKTRKTPGKPGQVGHLRPRNVHVVFTFDCDSVHLGKAATCFGNPPAMGLDTVSHRSRDLVSEAPPGHQPYSCPWPSALCRSHPAHLHAAALDMESFTPHF